MSRHSITIAFVTLVAACGFLSMPFGASAHPTGASWEVPVGKYTADIGYNPVTFTAGVYSSFDFYLWVGTTTTDANGIVSGVPADFSQVWIRILDLDTQDTLLATGIWKQPIGPTTLLYEFTQPGSYKLEVSFRDANANDIAVVPIPITVTSGGSFSPYWSFAGFFLAGCLVGFLALFFLRRRK